MRRVKRRPFWYRVGRGERGAVATIFTVLVAGGVVMSMLALSIDVGTILFERRQLQNGADATSLALADKCANDAPNCDPTDPDVQDLLGLNASDQEAQYDPRADAPLGACGRGNTWTVFDTTVIPECASAGSDAPITDLTECPPLPSWLKGNGATIPYVETYSLTKTDDGDPATDDTILPKRFSQFLVGGGGGDTRVSACARAAWGPVGGYTGSVPITFSTCEWMDATANGTNYYDKSPVGAFPGYGASNPWPSTAMEVMILLHDPQDESTDCVWNNKDTAGGFGFVDGNNCSATITTTVSGDSWAGLDVGNNLPQGCDTVIPGLLGKTVFLPVFDCLVSSQTVPVGGIGGYNCDPTQQQSSGNNAYYHVAGWAKFYLSGYRLGGNGGVVQSSILPNSTFPGPCSSSQRCISGWFLKGSLVGADEILPPGGSTDYGTYAVLPAG